MDARTFWRTVTVDDTNLLERLIAILEENAVRYCVVGGQGVNAYVEPVVSLDLDLAVDLEQLDLVESLMQGSFTCRRFPHSLNVSQEGSDLRVQFQTDLRYGPFVQRSRRGEILKMSLPVAAVEDLLQGKVWAAQDPERRPSKRQKDLADIARLLESYPHLRGLVPEDILRRLV